ncbi:TetR/AcrR family transcriptional regulator [Streptomyces europaeiscabiei]|uniref:TetR/AcrR family transcriptional regulator n=1 Tax=Streptomyces europaeiscabiei TaxID=146819 RepID=A0ABU4NGC1_9ACTN|nr:TetR/AcrR family transcriptional regulator [Streptomyces europaeiscabiei]MDX3544176.1 TetR/AcrR family transcriptional regulator [Streptomyces europaeiscabiei]MDX3552410.1 TetR/AcrR family transcriptional regulator [Streptomyces europaeiscabiei]MDX3701202.1 TetR/AcrR family transcriptional regulator [Streptomyces europaeiscabiei]
MSRAESGPPSYGSPRGRPRSEAVEQAILEAVMKLLEDGVPLADLSVERIARTAGVGKAAIYRRWSAKEDLFVDVIRAADPAERELPGTSMRDDLVILLEALRRRRLAGRSSAILHNAHAQMRCSPKIWAAYHAAVITPRRDLGLEVLRRGRLNGELRTDVDLELAIDMFVGPLIVRSFARPDPDLPDGLAEQIVDTVLNGLQPDSSPRT